MKRGSLIALLSLLLILSAISLFIGVRNITPWGLLQASEDQLQVFVISRVPRLIAILTAGASMSVAGLIMQQLARNKFVSPSTAGTMESASLGVLVATIGFGSASVLQKMTIAFVFALAGTLIFMRILERAQYKDVIIVPLVGIMFGGVIGACTTFIALRYDLLQSLDSWMNGDFSGVLRGRYELLYIAVPLTVVAYLFADRFTLASMGADFAISLGLNYKQVVHLGAGDYRACDSGGGAYGGRDSFFGLNHSQCCDNRGGRQYQEEPAVYGATGRDLCADLRYCRANDTDIPTRYRLASSLVSSAASCSCS